MADRHGVGLARVFGAGLVISLFMGAGAFADVNAQAVGWEGGTGGWYSTTLNDVAQAASGEVTATSDNWPAHSYGYEAHATSRQMGDASVGVYGLANDPLNDRNGVRAYGEAMWQVEFDVTQPGTIRYPVHLDVDLSTPTSDGWWYQSQFDAATNLRAKGYNYVNVPGMYWAAGAELEFTWSGGLTEDVYGLSSGEFARTGGVGHVSASRYFEASLAEGRYQLFIQISGSAWSDGFTAPENVVVLNALNSMGFGGDFWSVVEGDAHFEDVNDPTKFHIPEPSAVLLHVCAGAWLLLVRVRARAGRAG